MIEEINDWSEIDWKVINRNIKFLRRRIYQARSEGNFRKLRNLQRLMLKSSANIIASIRAVSSNSGNKTPGIDGETLETPRFRLNLFKEIREQGYMGSDPKPSRRIYIKEINKLRPISIPTIKDRVIQTMVKNALEPEWEAIFEYGSYGFRPRRNINDAIARIWGLMNRQSCRQWVVDADISKCFDSISHKYLINQLSNFPGKLIIIKWLNSGVIIRDIWFSTEDEGVPQGSSISPLLCNICLHGLEDEVGVMYKNQPNGNPTISSIGRALIRFADDMVIMSYTKADAIEGLNLLSKALEKRGLKISELKTKIVHVTEGFDFLGFHFKLSPKRHASHLRSINDTNKDNVRINYKMSALYIAPSNKGIKKVKGKLKEISKTFSSNLTTLYIKKMNEVIRGYAQSKWYWHSSITFSQLDHYVYILCMRWMKRRHPNKNVGWLVNYYFKTIELADVKSKWVFHAKNSNLDDYAFIYMYHFSWFRLSHYRFAEMRRNPDNREDAMYFEDLRRRRDQARPFSIFFRTDRDLAQSQFHLCPVCNESLYNGERLQIHHIIPRSEKGKSVFSNLVYLHTFCHMKIHNKDQFPYFRTFLYNYRKAHPRIHSKRKLKKKKRFSLKKILQLNIITKLLCLLLC